MAVQLTMQQRLNMICNVLENVRGHLNGMESIVDGLRQQIGMRPHFSDGDSEEVEDDENDEDEGEEENEVEQPTFVFAIRARTNVKGVGKSQTVYLRKSPLKVRGWQKWWSESVADSSVNICANPKQQRRYMESLQQVNPNALNPVHSLALHKIPNPLLKGEANSEESGFVIVDPNPPSMKGVNHYYTGEVDCDESYQDNEDRRDMEWSSHRKRAFVFSTEAEAAEELKVIKREKRKYWGKHSIGPMVVTTRELV